ncbi:MAG: CAP domain-containing protein, partial [Candidatus Pacearchaeota archaeon]
GELHPDAKGAYLSVGDKTLAIGKNTEGKGPEVKFEPGNRFLDKITTEQNVVMSAGRDSNNKNNAETGTIKITNRGESAPEIVMDKSFSVINGKLQMKTGKNAEGTEVVLIRIDESAGKSYAMEISDENRFLDEKGNKYKYVLDSNNKVELANVEREPIKLNTDLKEPGRETLVSWPQLEKTIFRINQGGQAEKPEVVKLVENEKPITDDNQFPFEVQASIRANEVINQFRNEQGFPNLKWDENLAKDSYEWSKHMAETLNRLKHTDLNVAENIAMFTSNNPLSPTEVGAHLANQWITSKTGHRENILKARQITGIGVYVKRSAIYGYEYYATERFK